MKRALLSLFSFNSAKNAKLMLSTLIAIAFCIPMNAQADICEEVENLVLACNGNINVALNSECEAEITLAMILSGEPYNNPNYPNLTEDDFELVIMSNGVVVPAASSNSTFLSNGELGTAITASVSIPECGITCWGTITLEDKTESVLNNCDDLEITCEEFESGATENDVPTFDGNCSITMGSLSFEDDTLGTMCLNGYALTIERTWTALDDDGGFLATCSQLINVLRFDVDDVVFPDDFIYDYTQNDACDVFTDEFLVPSRTGEPTGIRCPNIMHFYNDTDFELCGVSRKILRTWTVIDWCTGETREDGQIIKVEDDEPVIKVCPPDTLMFPTAGGKCFAQINLDPFALEHGIGQIQNLLIECSEFEIFVEYLPAVPGTQQPAEDGEYSSVGITIEDDGTYSLPMIPEGLAWVRYRFVDACGNASPITNPGVGTDDSGSCYFEVQVIDTLPPTAICEGFTKVSLDQSGFAEVFAETFDDHSFDICGEVVDFEVKLLEDNTCTGFESDLLYGPSLHFCCDNLGDTLSIMLKVIDDTGRFSECEARVCIAGMDDTSFSVECPDDIDRSCGFDYESFDYGDVQFTSDIDICGMDGTPTVTDISFNETGLDLCGIGVVIRTVTIELPNGQATTCSSRITLSQNNPLEYDDISIDPVLSVEGCGNQFSGFEPEIIGGFPTISNNDVCVSLTMDYEDTLLSTGADSDECHKILRKWTVIDWCTYQVNNGYTGFFTFDQIIKLNDAVDPMFSDPCVDITLEAEFPECTAQFTFDIWAEDNCTPAGDLTYTYVIDVANGSTINGSGNIIDDITLPGGVHTVTITAFDFCGNTDVCIFEVTVVGNNPPVPICLASIVWVLDDQGQADVWASDFDLKSEAGCGNVDDLSFSFTNPNNGPLTPNMSFDCSDIPNGIGASIELEVFVVDASGAFESCVVTLKLQDSQQVCEDDEEARAFIGGKVFNEKLLDMEQVELELYENMTNLMSEEMTNSGDYMFNDVPFYNGYMVKPTKEDAALNGVSTLDILLIQKHILDVQRLDSPYKIIAADVNRSNTVTAVDLIEIRKLILGLYSDWQSSEPWVFVPDSHIFADVENPWNFPETVVYNNLYVSDDQANFFGVKIGDVNGNAAVNFANQAVENRSGQAFRMGTNNVDFKADQDLRVVFNAIEDANIDGLQFTIEFDAAALTFTGYEGGLFPLAGYNIGLQNAVEGIITVSYDEIKGVAVSSGIELFALNFKTKLEDKVENVVTINSAVTIAEAYTTEGEIQDVILQTSGSLVQNGSFELFQNQPNPFNNSTEIGFYLPEAGAATLDVMSADGKVIFSKTRGFEKGMNSIILDANNLENKGILLYRLEYNGYSATKKMIYIN